MLLVSKNDVFEVSVNYIESSDNIMFYENDIIPMPDGMKNEKFIFRRPNWTDIKTISSTSCHIDALTGETKLDPFRYMDQKIKILLKDWSLKDGEAKVPVSWGNIDLLRPELVQYLFQKVEEKFAMVEAAPVPVIPKITTESKG